MYKIYHGLSEISTCFQIKKRFFRLKSAFSEHFHISKRQAYRYLLAFKGMQFLYDCYEGAHTQSIEDAVADLTIICQRHGGALYD